MNAIQFIQQYGIEKARKVIDGAPNWAMSINFNNGMYYSRMEHKKGDTFLYDIKQLVESVDLVNCNGGWNGTKNTITLFQSSLDIGLYHGLDGVDAEVEIQRLKQAIKYYEEIYKCTYCNGFGEVGCQFEGTFTCPDCNGDRYVGGDHV